jgi:hypothetical protein
VQEPEIATTLRALLDSRYPHAKLHVVVATREDEGAPSGDGVSTAELVRRFESLPPWQQRCSLVALPGEEKRTSSTGRCGPGAQAAARLRPDPARVWIGLSDADSIPDERIAGSPPI